VAETGAPQPLPGPAAQTQHAAAATRVRSIEAQSYSLAHRSPPLYLGPPFAWCYCFAAVNRRHFIVGFCAAAVACAHPAPPPPAPPTSKAPLCSTQVIDTAGLPSGATVICRAPSTVAYDELHEAATFDAAKAAMAARRTHLVTAREEKRAGAPAERCPEPPAPDNDEKLRLRFSNMTGATTQPVSKKEPCTPIPGSEAHVLELTVRFLRAAEAATTPGARSASQVLGMWSGSPTTPPADARADGGMDGTGSDQ
jgi:hypothetical protein